jgi:hypothetical protein
MISVSTVTHRENHSYFLSSGTDPPTICGAAAENKSSRTMNQTEHSLKSLPRTFAKRNVRLEIYRMMRNAERQRLMRSAPASVIADLS